MPRLHDDDDNNANSSQINICTDPSLPSDPSNPKPHDDIKKKTILDCLCLYCFPLFWA